MTVIALVRGNIVENIGTTPLGDEPLPAGVTAHEYDGPLSTGWTWNNGSPVDLSPQPEPTQYPVATPEQKLAASGLTVDELKQLLGLA